MIETTRCLNFLLFLPRWHVDLQRPLDFLLLFGRGIEEIDPNRLLVNARLAFLWTSAPDRVSKMVSTGPVPYPRPKRVHCANAP